MKMLGKSVVLACALMCGWLVYASAAEAPAFTRQEDVIYGRKYGTALTMDVFKPAKANGAAVVVAVSGGWFSSHDGINPAFYRELLKRGYTVFAVVHGSQPKYTIPEVLTDMHRALRFIRTHAGDYHIDPDRIGMTGGSAGGHLSLMQGTAGKDGDPKAKDPVDRASSRVQAVACFFPPTDFLNYGEKGHSALGRGTLSAFKAPFDFRELDPKSRSFELITDEDRRRAIGKDISPVYHVTPDDAPTLIIHGDADKLVPIQQAEIIIGKLKEAGVPAELVVKQGAGHGWKGMEKDMSTIADWFDKYLKKRNPGDIAAAKPGEMLLSHDVYFTLKENSGPAREKLVAACKKYLSGHPGEVFFAAGARAEDLKREVNDLDFDVALHIVFQNQASQDKYQEAPRHKQFIEENKETWQKVRVFDSVVQR